MDKILLTLLAIITLITTGILHLNTQNKHFLSHQENLQKIYTKWKSDYNQNFNGPEDLYRFSIFSKNYNFMQSHNSKSKNLILGLNQFSSLTNQEFKQLIAIQIPFFQTIESNVKKVKNTT